MIADFEGVKPDPDDKVIATKNKTTGQTEYVVFMPGLERMIAINDGWQFNGNKKAPTFSPSLLTNGGAGGRERSHCFVRDGMVQFLGDCSHALAGKTVELPAVKDWPE